MDTQDFTDTEIDQLYTWVRDVAQSTCPECGEPTGFCYLICSHSEHYYSPEQERDDDRWNDSLGYNAWFSLAVRQYESVHGEGSYCS